MPRKEVANAKRRVDVQPIRSATRKKTANSKTGYNKSAKKNIKRVLSNGGKPEIRAVEEERTFGERQTILPCDGETAASRETFPARSRNVGRTARFINCIKKNEKSNFLRRGKWGREKKVRVAALKKKVKTAKMSRIDKIGRARRESR